MISNGETKHCLAVKKLLALLRRITTERHCDCYCLNCINYFVTKNKREYYKKVSENKEFCSVAKTYRDIKIFEFNQY